MTGIQYRLIHIKGKMWFYQRISDGKIIKRIYL